MGLFDAGRERIAVVIQALGGDQVVKTFRQIGDAAGKASTDTENRFTRLADGALSRLGLQGKVSGQALAAGVAVAAGAAATAITGLVAAGVHQFADLAEKVRDFQRMTGASAEESSRFVAVLDDLQINADAAGSAMFKLARNATNNAKTFSDLGISIAANDDGTLNLTETLLNAADAYSQTSDQGEKARIAFALFGKQSAELVPLLAKGREGLQAFFADAEHHNQILNQDDLDKAENYRLALDDLSDAVQGLERSLGEGAVPALTKFASFLTSTTDILTTSAQGWGGAISDVLGVFGVHSDNAGRSQQKLAYEAQQTAAAMDAEEKALADATKELHDNVDAVLDAQDAQDKLRSALEHLAEARSVDKAEAVADAEQDVTDAHLAQETAANRLADAQAKLNDLKDRDLSLELRRAELADRRARQNEREAQLARTRAAAELARIQGDTASTPDQLAQAQQDLEEANLRVDEATQATADSQKALNDLRNPQKTNEYRDAELAVREAQAGVARAADTAEEAQRKLNETRAHDNSKDIAAAQRAVQRAIEDIGKSGGSIDQQIAAYQRLFDVAPEFRQFIQDRIFELQALRYEANLTQESLGNMLGVISGEQTPPPRPPEAVPTTPVGQSGSSGLERIFSNVTNIHVDTVQAHDYLDFRRQMDDEKRNNALAQ